MLDHFGLPRLFIVGKLYGAIALTLAVVYGLAAGTTRFASETEQGLAWVHEQALKVIARAGEIETALRRQRELLAAVSGEAGEALARSEHAYGERMVEISAGLALLEDPTTQELGDLLSTLKAQ